VHPSVSCTDMRQHHLRVPFVVCRLENQLRSWAGVLPHDAIVADRAFNTRSLVNAQLGYDAVASVEYDPRTAPDR
jgi:hypothetical protein